MRRIWILGGLIMALAMPAVALAAAQGEAANIVLAKGDNRTGTYYAAGQTVTVDGDVAGDVVCGGQTVIINGSVGGDVLCGAQNLTVNGTVGGSVRAVGQVVTVNGNVTRNITVGAQNFVLGSKAAVGGDVVVGGQTAALAGSVGQAVYAGVQDLTLSSSVGGNVTARVQTLTLGGGAALAGNLDYTSPNEFSLDKTKVHGTVARHAAARTMSPASSVGARLGSLVYLVVATLIGTLLMIWLAPRLVRTTVKTMQKRWSASVGWGALTVIVGPALLAVVALSIVGLPAAVVAGGLWILALVTSSAFAGVAVGKMALKTEDDNRGGLAMAALAGVPIVVILSWLPLIGGLFGLAATLWAVGGMVLAANRARALG